MAATQPAAAPISSNYSSISSLHRQENPGKVLMLTTGILKNRTKSSNKRALYLVRASSEPRREGTNKAAFVSQEDLKYLLKLGGGSVAGAAAIKYGSIIFPAITSPNLAQALVMVTAPVLVAVLLLINQSRSD